MLPRAAYSPALNTVFEALVISKDGGIVCDATREGGKAMEIVRKEGCGSVCCVWQVPQRSKKGGSERPVLVESRLRRYR